MSVSIQPPRLRDNVAALSLVQASNYVIPIVMLPYLTRVLGAQAFGKMVFAQVLIAYAILLVDYGFSWSATREVAANRTDTVRTSRIFLASWAVQWILLIFALLLLTIVVFSSERLRSDALLFVAASTSILGNLLFPVWFLQGLEQLKVVAVIQFFIRLLALLPIFGFVSHPEHAVRVLFINGTMSIAGGFCALYWIYRRQLVHWHWPMAKHVIEAFRLGQALFGSRILISFYTNLVPFVLGWVAGPVALAHFNVADKLRTAGQSLLLPMMQALYPRISHLAVNDQTSAFYLLKRSALVLTVVAGGASLCLWLLAERLIVLLSGYEFVPAASVLRWLAPLPLVIGYSNLLGVLIMLPKGMNRIFNLVLLAAAILGGILVWPMTSTWADKGAAQTLLVVETFVTVTMVAILWRKGLFSSDQWRYF